MSAMTPTPAASVPLVLALSGDDLACLACGVAVAGEDVGERITTEAVGREGVPAPVNPTAPPTRIVSEFTRCRRCALRHEAAARIVADLPGLAARLGPDTARHRVSCALDALAMLRATYPARFDAGEVGAMLRHLSAPGAAARWSARFAPVLATGARTQTATAGPWQHVSPEVRQDARDALAAVLAERVARSAPDARITPPEGTACLLCGVGHVVVPAARVTALGGSEAASRAVWTLAAADPAALGGPRSPERLHGALCPPCGSAVGEAGAMGETAMRAALGDYLTEQGRTAEATVLRAGEVGRVIAWAGLDRREQSAGRPALAPNREPWAHLRIPTGADG